MYSETSDANYIFFSSISYHFSLLVLNTMHFSLLVLNIIHFCCFYFFIIILLLLTKEYI